MRWAGHAASTGEENCMQEIGGKNRRKYTPSETARGVVGWIIYNGSQTGLFGMDWIYPTQDG
jgi:hypothetical protein